MVRRGPLAVTSPATAQARRAPAAIDGIVTDTALARLADVTVSLLGSSARVVTRANGRFRIVDLPPGEYVLFLRRIGYASVSSTIELTAGDTLRPSFTLRRAVAELDTVVVADKGGLSPIEREFEQRRRSGEGQFLTQAQIERLNFVDLETLMRTFKAVAIGSDGPVNLRPPQCTYQTYLDGVALEPARIWKALPPPSQLFGIEVYSGPTTIPLQFKPFGEHTSAFCGVVLVWTKRGKS
jgi:hypothetical protein